MIDYWKGYSLRELARVIEDYGDEYNDAGLKAAAKRMEELADEADDE